ncbi:unnamed protein product [Macrosiphum euphorbiae]|nr:unnamed protein product [Macrosiphum euphorbiae]
MESWRKMSDDINVNTWGKAFKYAKNGPRNKAVISSLTKEDGSLRQGPLERHVPVEEQQVKNAIWRMKPPRAPGLDGITTGILRKAWPIAKDSMTQLMNR